MEDRRANNMAFVTFSTILAVFGSIRAGVHWWILI